MPNAVFEFLPDLNSFLARGRRSGIFSGSFDARQTVKHLVEAAGVPHTEVGQVLAGQAPVDFDYQVREGDRIRVFPALPGQAVPETGMRFVLDNHLGRLAAYLRMLGLDVLYHNDFQDDELARIASHEQRILLTRDRRLLMRKAIQYGYCLRSLESHQQAREILRRYPLPGGAVPFQRCLRCNTLLEPVEKNSVLDVLEPLTRQYYDEFQRCPACGHVYWKGSHYEKMIELIDRLQPGGPASSPDLI